jgi:prolyl oligopeptidase
LFIETDLNAPNKRIVTVDVNNPSPSNWVDFIPETETFCPVHRAGFFANYMKDAVSVVKQYDYIKLRNSIASLGSAGGFEERKETLLFFY